MRRLVKRLLAVLALMTAMAFPAPGAERQLTPADEIQKALDAAAPDDTIVLKDGVYYQNLVITRGGIAGKPVTLRAAKGGAATLSGAVPPGEGKLKFQRVEGDLYRAAVPHRVWWAMAGARNLVNYGKLEHLKEFQFPRPDKPKPSPCPPEGFAWQDGFLYVRLEGGADPNAAAIEIHRPGGHSTADPSFSKESHYAPDTGFEVPGTGHMLSKTLANIVIKADHVVIEGLRLHMGVGAAVVVHGDEVTIRDCYMSGTHMGVLQPDSVRVPARGKPPIAGSNRTSRGLTVEHCEFSSYPSYQWLKRNEKFWSGLYSTNIAGVFMNFGGPRSVCRHNWLYECFDGLQPRGNGTDSPDDASEIAYNLIQNCADDSIEFDSVTAMNLRVHHNIFLDGHCLLAISPVMGGGLTIDHNILYVSPENGLTWCALFKGGSPWGSGLPTQGMRIVHNTMVNTKGQNIGLWWVGGHRYENNVIENNIFYVARSQNFSARGLVFGRHNLYCGPNVDEPHMPQMMFPRLGMSIATQIRGRDRTHLGEIIRRIIQQTVQRDVIEINNPLGHRITYRSNMIFLNLLRVIPEVLRIQKRIIHLAILCYRRLLQPFPQRRFALGLDHPVEKNQVQILAHTHSLVSLGNDIIDNMLKSNLFLDGFHSGHGAQLKSDDVLDSLCRGFQKFFFNLVSGAQILLPDDPGFPVNPLRFGQIIVGTTL